MPAMAAQRMRASETAGWRSSSRFCQDAASTLPVTSRPRVSVMMNRFRPLIVLPAS